MNLNPDKLDDYAITLAYWSGIFATTSSFLIILFIFAVKHYLLLICGIIFFITSMYVNLKARKLLVLSKEAVKLNRQEIKIKQLYGRN